MIRVDRPAGSTSVSLTTSRAAARSTRHPGAAGQQQWLGQRRAGQRDRAGVVGVLVQRPAEAAVGDAPETAQRADGRVPRRRRDRAGQRFRRHRRRPLGQPTATPARPPARASPAVVSGPAVAPAGRVSTGAVARASRGGCGAGVGPCRARSPAGRRARPVSQRDHQRRASAVASTGSSGASSGALCIHGPMTSARGPAYPLVDPYGGVAEHVPPPADRQRRHGDRAGVTVRHRQTGCPGGCRPTSTRYGSDCSTRSRQRRCSSGSWKPASGGRSWLTSVPTPQTAERPDHAPRAPAGMHEVPLRVEHPHQRDDRPQRLRPAGRRPQRERGAPGEAPHPDRARAPGLAAAHSTAATPSSASAGSNGARAGPSEEPSPRQSTSTQRTRPRRTGAASSSNRPRRAVPPVRHHRTTAGTGPAPAGRNRSAPRLPPIRTPRRTDTVT